MDVDKDYKPETSDASESKSDVVNEWRFKACRQLMSYWAHLHIKNKCEVEITYMCNNIRQR